MELACADPFEFRAADGRLTGGSAQHLSQFHAELERCPSVVVADHDASADFSRWIAHVIGDEHLVRSVRDAELAAGSGGTEDARSRILTAIGDRYLV